MKARGENVATKDIKNLCVATLHADKKDQQALGFYFNVSQDLTISTKGPNEVHLSGYFEPSPEAEQGALGDMAELGLEDSDEEEGEDSVDLSDEDNAEAAKLVKGKKKDLPKKAGVVGFEKGGDVDKGLKAAKMNALKNTKTEDSDDDDDSSDEEVDLAALKNGEADGDEDDDDASSDDDDLDIDDDSDDEPGMPDDDDDDEEEELAAKIMSKAKNT